MRSCFEDYSRLSVGGKRKTDLRKSAFIPRLIFLYFQFFAASSALGRA